MAFNFGGTSTFGSTPNKPTAFGAPLTFGTPVATTASTGFGFGSTFGSGTSQPTFGSTFGQPAAGATAPTFGSTFGQPASAAPAFGSTFGTPASATPAFGSTFGTPATSAPAFGSTFGATASATPAFGSTFGASTGAAPAFGASTSTVPAFGASATPAFGAAASAAPAFGASTTQAFGSTFGAASTTPNLFGTPAATKPSLFGTPATTTTSLFGVPPATAPSLFGTTTTTQAPSLFGTPATSTTAPSLFGTATTSAPSLFGSTFGATATTSAPSLFGTNPSTGFGLGTSTGTTGFSLFGSGTTTSAPSLFSGFGKTTTTASGFTGFGTGSTGFTGFGGATTTSAPSWFGGTTPFTGARPPAPIGVPGAVQPQSQTQQALASVLAINIFGDERDNILKKWNMLQACWGTGKGYYSTTQPPVEYNCNNPFFRYKAIGYVIIPGEDSSRGIVKLIFNKKESELSSQKEALSNGLLGVLGNKPNLTIHISNIKSIGDNQCEVMFSVSEKGVTGTNRKIPATDLCAFLNQPVQKQQLTNVGVIFIGAYVSPSKAQVEEYLKNPPIGIETQAWNAAQIDNPNPLKYMPSIENGFADLKKRMLLEQHETALHRGYLDKITKELDDMRKKHTNSIAKISELKQKYALLHHRLLKIIIKQEVTRKVGMALQPDEELLRGRLESLMSQLVLPTQFKGLMYEIKCRTNLSGYMNAQQQEYYKIDPAAQEDIKQFLKMEQNGIANLINIINTDMKHLKIITEGLTKMQTK